MEVNGKELRRSTRVRKPNPKYTNGVASSTRRRSTRRRSTRRRITKPRSTKRKIPVKANYKKPTRPTLSNMRRHISRASKKRHNTLYARRMQRMKLMNSPKAGNKANELPTASGRPANHNSYSKNNTELANLFGKIGI
jgi:hypothetical protein